MGLLKRQREPALSSRIHAQGDLVDVGVAYEAAAQQPLRGVASPDRDISRDVSDLVAEAPGERVDGDAPRPDEFSELAVVDAVPVHPRDDLCGQQEVSSEGIRCGLVLAGRVGVQTVVVMAEDQVTEFVGHVPVLAEPVPSRRNHNDPPSTGRERVGGGQFRDANDVYAKRLLQALRERAHEVRSQLRVYSGRTTRQGR